MPYMSLSGRKLQVDSFLTHNLVTAPLIWILHNRITYYAGTKRYPLNSYWSKINLFRYSGGMTCKY